MALNGTYRAARLATAVGAAVLGLALAGCTPRRALLPPPPPPANYALEPMVPCSHVIADTEVRASVSITLPPGLNFTRHRRDVSWTSGYVDPATPRLAFGRPNGPHKPEPFDVAVAEATTETSGYVLIRVAIPRGGTVSFAQVGAMNRLARGYVAPAPSGVICGADTRPVGPGGPIAEVAFFYLDLSLWTDRTQYVPFAIIVQAGDLYATPIIIDPKLRNSE